MNTTVSPLLRAAREVFLRYFDREPLRMGVEEGVVWAIVAGPLGFVNGYAMIPAEGHPWSAGFPDDVEDIIDVHGGVTYCRHPWVGFDTGHYTDVWDEAHDPHGVGRIAREHRAQWSIDWTEDLVEEEAKRLARQVAEVAALGKQFNHIEIQEES